MNRTTKPFSTKVIAQASIVIGRSIPFGESRSFFYNHHDECVFLFNQLLAELSIAGWTSDWPLSDDQEFSGSDLQVSSFRYGGGGHWIRFAISSETPTFRCRDTVSLVW